MALLLWKHLKEDRKKYIFLCSREAPAELSNSELRNKQMLNIYKWYTKPMRLFFILWYFNLYYCCCFADLYLLSESPESYHYLSQSGCVQNSSLDDKQLFDSVMVRTLLPLSRSALKLQRAPFIHPLSHPALCSAKIWFFRKEGVKDGWTMTCQFVIGGGREV